ncbi:MAG: tail protein X [Ectothiorhodospiraceae bacterium]|nr:tail protein X [Ectothiorhodospiraceae bacterium]
MEEAIARQGDTVDLICHRHYGYTAGITEAVYRANRGLAELGPILPVGTRVKLPRRTEKKIRPTVKLWD